MRSACGPQPASESGSAPKSRGGRRSVCCWTNRAWGRAAAYAWVNCRPASSKMGRTGECAPPSRRLLETIHRPQWGRWTTTCRQPDSSASSTI